MSNILPKSSHASESYHQQSSTCSVGVKSEKMGFWRMGVEVRDCYGYLRPKNHREGHISVNRVKEHGFNTNLLKHLN